MRLQGALNEPDPIRVQLLVYFTNLSHMSNWLHTNIIY